MILYLPLFLGPLPFSRLSWWFPSFAGVQTVYITLILVKLWVYSWSLFKYSNIDPLEVVFANQAPEDVISDYQIWWVNTHKYIYIYYTIYVYISKMLSCMSCTDGSTRGSVIWTIWIQVISKAVHRKTPIASFFQMSF